MVLKTKPQKPRPDFPLFPHDNGQWAKKIRGKHRFFGVWDDWEAAEEKYEREREALEAGRDPARYGSDWLTVKKACNAFLNAKLKLLNSGELTQVTYDDYYFTCSLILDHFGRERSVTSLTAGDFESFRESLSKGRGPVALGNHINRTRIVFRYLDDADLIERPVKFGPHFRRPSASIMRKAKAKAGTKLFTQGELASVLEKANTRVKAMILLGINCGLGNMDIGLLETHHVNLKTGWLDYPRNKTGIRRRAKLWPETVRAIKSLPRIKPASRDLANRVFLTHVGRAWASDSKESAIASEMTKVLEKAKVRRPGLSFYALRHTFQTIGEESRDIPAVRFIMGHAPPSNDMSSVYRESISDARLIHIANHVKKWVFANKKVSLRVS